MTPAEITPVILTFNEEANITRTLESLHWAESVIVLDSGSTDDTEWICRSNPRVQWHTHPFQSFAHQWNYAITLVPTPWMLALDADYFLTPAFINELRLLEVPETVHGFKIPFRYCIHGHPLKNSLLPPRITLFRPASTHVVKDGHTQTFIVQGHVKAFQEPVWHDDRKPFSRWWSSQEKYADMEVEKLFHTPWSELRIQDKLRKFILPAPPAVLFFTLFHKGCFFGGKAGWIYTGQRVLAESLLSFKLLIAWLRA